jgi:hypothetical protein
MPTKEMEMYCLPAHQTEVIRVPNVSLFRVFFNKRYCFFACGHCGSVWRPSTFSDISDKKGATFWKHFKNVHHEFLGNKRLRRAHFIAALRKTLSEHGTREALARSETIEKELPTFTGVKMVYEPIEGLNIEWNKGRKCNMEGCNHCYIAHLSLTQHRREHLAYGTNNMQQVSVSNTVHPDTISTQQVVQYWGNKYVPVKDVRRNRVSVLEEEVEKAGDSDPRALATKVSNYHSHKATGAADSEKAKRVNKKKSSNVRHRISGSPKSKMDAAPFGKSQPLLSQHADEADISSADKVSDKADDGNELIKKGPHLHHKVDGVATTAQVVDDVVPRSVYLHDVAQAEANAKRKYKTKALRYYDERNKLKNEVKRLKVELHRAHLGYQLAVPL